MLKAFVGNKGNVSISSHQEAFYKKGFLEIFTKQGQLLCLSVLLKRDTSTGVYLLIFLSFFIDTYFE